MTFTAGMRVQTESYGTGTLVEEGCCENEWKLLIDNPEQYGISDDGSDFHRFIYERDMTPLTEEGSDSPELAAYKRYIAAKAMEAKVTYNLCEELERFLTSQGLDDFIPKQRWVKVEVMVPIMQQPGESDRVVRRNGVDAMSSVVLPPRSYIDRYTVRTFDSEE